MCAKDVHKNRKLFLNKPIVTARLFNEVSVQKNELKRLGYFITIPNQKK
ncbi:MAG: hypothetical protein L3J11_06810 [Draconibacterium sp.]|nr:hypothetical protein [Draconibacterium sp.]